MFTQQVWLSEEFDAALTYLNAVSKRLDGDQRLLLEGPLSELVRVRKEAVGDLRFNSASQVSSRMQ